MAPALEAIRGENTAAQIAAHHARELQAKIGQLRTENDFSYGPLSVHIQIDTSRGTTIQIF